MENKKISIIGLGLIGGSLAKALRQRTDIKDIIGIDKNIDYIEQAVKDGTISEGFTTVTSHIWSSDVIFICTPVKHIIEFINTAVSNIKPQCIITDVGSTKKIVIDYVNAMDNPPCFIGGHPMAGAEKNGYFSSFPHLFENAYYILTPCKNVPDSQIDFMYRLVKSIGAIPVVMDAHQHDRVTSGISHVPHIIASALVNMVKEMDKNLEGKMHMLAAGGFKDITRIASSSPEIWESIILTNREESQYTLDMFINILQKVKENINANDSKSIYDFFNCARVYRDSFTSNRKSLISPLYEIIVDVEDKPGIIGEIATLLGKNHINIKNINVSNSREFEEGCLRITLPDTDSVNKSFDLLKDSGYKVYINK